MKTIKILVVLALIFTVKTSYAQCLQTYITESGSVLSLKKKVVEVTPDNNQITLEVKKTDGKAQTRVNVYVNNSFREPASFEFVNASNSKTITKTIKNVKGKVVRVEIINQSIGNKFNYTLKLSGDRTSLISGSESKITGNLAGNASKTVAVVKSCTNVSTVTVRRTSGSARATVRILNNSNSNIVDTVTFEQGETVKNINVNHNQGYNVEVKNISIGNFFGYSVEAISR